MKLRIKPGSDSKPHDLSYVMPGLVDDAKRNTGSTCRQSSCGVSTCQREERLSMSSCLIQWLFIGIILEWGSRGKQGEAETVPLRVSVFSLGIWDTRPGSKCWVSQGSFRRQYPPSAPGFLGVERLRKGQVQPGRACHLWGHLLQLPAGWNQERFCVAESQLAGLIDLGRSPGLEVEDLEHQLTNLAIT